MVAKGERFLTCPDCLKRGVYYVPRPRNEDGYVCRYCDFECFCCEANVDSYDWDAAHRLNEVNA